MSTRVKDCSAFGLWQLLLLLLIALPNTLIRPTDAKQQLVPLSINDSWTYIDAFSGTEDTDWSRFRESLADTLTEYEVVKSIEEDAKDNLKQKVLGLGELEPSKWKNFLDIITPIFPAAPNLTANVKEPTKQMLQDLMPAINHALNWTTEKECRDGGSRCCC